MSKVVEDELSRITQALADEEEAALAAQAEVHRYEGLRQEAYGKLHEIRNEESRLKHQIEYLRGFLNYAKDRRK